MKFQELYVALGGDGLARQAANTIFREYEGWGVSAEHLSSLRRDELLDLRNFGPLSLERVEEWLAREGMRLQPSPGESTT